MHILFSLLLLHTNRKRFYKKGLNDDICILCTYTVRNAGKQVRRKTARGRESRVVIIDQEDGNSSECLSL